MHRTRPGGLNGGEMYGTRAGSTILLLLSDMLRSHRFGAMMKSGVSRRSSLMVVRTRTCTGAVAHCTF